VRIIEQKMTEFWRQCLHTGLLLLIVVVGFAAGPVMYASSEQPLDSLTAIAVLASKESALRQGYENITVTTRPLDKRLRLPLCNQALSTFAPQNNQVLGAISIGVRCAGTNPWTIYVRTNVSAQQAVPVLTSPLGRHAVIGKNDLHLIDMPLQSMPNGIIYDADKIIGMELTRPLDAGVPFKLNQLRLPRVVIRGQQVTLVTGLGGLEVRTQGKALRDAVAGKRVTVVNLNSGRQVEGIALSDGTVRVP